MLWSSLPQDVPSFHRGRRYLVFRLSGEGGVPLVVKTVRPGPLATSSSAMLRHEYEILCELEVPGVVKPVGLEEVAGQPALLLEDAGPRNLQEWLDRKPVGIDVFLLLALQLAEIVEGLHRQHVIHRDLNPTNVVVAADSAHLTLVDFGTSTKVAGLASAAGVPGEFQGTLPYIAPEQTGRMNRLVDHRADLYSLGATLYELLIGTPPFTSADPAELVHGHLARPPVPLASITPSIPRILSDIVLKLLAKMPEERYQSAEALRADLREAQRRWQASGAIPSFELGRYDLAKAITVPQKLYGRQRECAALKEALERARAGASEQVLVEGPAGIGKSALVNALRGPMEEGQGRLISGKFDSLHGNLPYAPLVDAFRRLIRDLLQEPEESLEAWRRRLRRALGINARVIADVIPELGHLLGALPPVPELGPVESENRFHLAFQTFVQIAAELIHPLVLFLDDLQWADSASLKLIHQLATAPNIHSLLLVGAFRTEEVDPGHPLSRTLEEIRAAGATVHSLVLAPLDTGALTELCADALRCPPARARPLATLVQQKTAGNPFFVGRFLRFLHQSGLLTFDVERGAWEWELARVEKVGITENVVELMLMAIRRLPERTQHVLKVAACFRNRVDLWLLAALVGQSVGKTAGLLWSAIREGLLVPWSEGPRFARVGADGEVLVQDASYCFVHDRVQQAASSLLPQDERQWYHLQLGRRLEEGLSGAGSDELLFEVVDHLNLGAALVGEPSERLHLARLNLQAGLKAKASSAFGPALAYLTRGLGLLPKEAWKSQYTLWFQLHRESAECAYVNGDHSRAELLLQTALAHAASRYERADLYTLRVIVCTARRDYPEAIRWGREGLRLFGAELPEHDVASAVAAEFAAVEKHRRGRSMKELLDAAPMEDPDQLASVRLLAILGSPAFFSDPTLFAFLRTRIVNLTLEHGNTPDSSQSYVSYGMLLGETTGDSATGHAFGRLGVELGRRYGARLECRALTLFVGYLNHWRAPLRDNVPLARRAFAAGLETGEFHFASYACGICLVGSLFSMGTELSLVLAENEVSKAFARKAGQWTMADTLSAYRQAIRCLQGKTRGRARYDGDGFDERTFLQSIQGFPFNRCIYEVLRLQTSYLLGDFQDAREMSAAAEPHLMFVRGIFCGAEHNFYTSLTLAALCAEASPAEKASLLARIADNQRWLGKRAESCPENFRHKYLLVAAEVARLEPRSLEAMDLYEQAIDTAHQEGLLQDEALANELAGRYYRALGRERFAQLYLRNAIEKFARWGATAKVESLEEEFPDLQPLETSAWRSSSSRTKDESLDFLSLLKAGETLYSEVLLSRLLDKLMGVCIQVGGAQRGALILEEEGALVVRAIGSLSEPVSAERMALASCQQVPVTAIEHAYRTGNAVVLADAAHQGLFVSDAYVAAHAVKSALAVPIRRQAKPVGVLYLENNLATRVFTPERVRVLQLLSSQMTIALENSFLFEKLKVEVEERRRAEEVVRFLAESGLALAQSLDYETTLARVARLAVPFLADGCVVDVLEKGGRIRRVAAAHADPAKELLLMELQERYPPDWDSPHPAAAVLRTGQPLLLSEPSEAEMLSTCKDARHYELLRALGIRTAMAVPLTAREKTLGAITFGSSVPGRHYGPADLAVAQELARRAAIFIDNARLYGEAQEAIRLREEFLTVAAHELYTPLAALKLSVQGFQKSAGATPSAAVLRTTRGIERQMQRLKGLIDELLDVSRIQSGRLHLHLEEVDLAEVARDVAERFSETLQQTHCSLSLHAGTPVPGRWDRLRLEQVLTNLLSNAIKFSAGKPIELTVDTQGDTARVVVRDEGIGIAPKSLPYIFERFERAVSVREYGGLGLGLYIVREIVTALGGQVRAESVVGRGTTFTVELPRSGPPPL